MYSSNAIKVDGRKYKKSGRVGIRRVIFERLAKHESPTKIARSLGLSRQCIYLLKKRLIECNYDIDKAVIEKPSGPKNRDTQRALTLEQQKTIIAMITDKTPEQYKFEFVLWTLEAIRQLIKKTFDVLVSKVTISKY